MKNHKKEVLTPSQLSCKLGALKYGLILKRLQRQSKELQK